jgi:hypothetical protein
MRAELRPDAGMRCGLVQRACGKARPAGIPTTRDDLFFLFCPFGKKFTNTPLLKRFLKIDLDLGVEVTGLGAMYFGADIE